MTRAAAAAPPSLADTGLEGFVPALMNRIMAGYNAMLREDLARHGLTTAKMRALAVLSVIDAPSITALATHTVTEKSTLSRALDQLAAEGLIRRDPDPADSRTTRVRLTDHGRAAFETIWPHLAAAQHRLMQGLTDDEARALVGTLQRILRNIRKHDF